MFTSVIECAAPRPNQNQRNKEGVLWKKLVSFLPYALLIAASYFEFSETVDDPYITFRYAYNLLGGYGAVFNVGERVEGYTSILHLFLSAFLLSVFPSVDILMKAKLVSLTFGTGMVFLTARLGTATGLKNSSALFAQCLVAANVNFAISAVNGLETTIGGFLLLLCLIRFIRECRDKHGQVSAFLLFLCLMARPEALLFFAALFCARCVWYHRTKASFSFVFRWVLLFLLPTCLLTLLRWHYYHALLPNTYYAKQQALSQTLMPGFKYLLQPLSVNAFSFLHHRLEMAGLFGLVFAAVFWSFAALGLWHLRKRLEGVVFAAILGAFVVFVVKAGGDWMYGWRFMVSALPILAVLQCYGGIVVWQRLARRIGRTSGFLRYPLWVVLLSAVWVVAFITAPHCSWALGHFSTRGVDLLATSNKGGKFWVSSGRYIHDQLPNGAFVAYSELGYAGFVNLDKRFLDTRGLTDQEIARLPSRYKGNTGVNDLSWTVPGDPLYAILRRRQPDYILSRDGGGKQTVLEEYRYAPANSADNLDQTQHDPQMPLLLVYKRAK